MNNSIIRTPRIPFLYIKYALVTCNVEDYLFPLAVRITVLSTVAHGQSERNLLYRVPISFSLKLEWVSLFLLQYLCLIGKLYTVILFNLTKVGLEALVRDS